MSLSDKEQDIVRGGLAAADLLGHDAFNTTVKSLAYELFCQFIETKPHERHAREAIYNQYLGLQAIESTLNTRVHQKDEIQRRLDASHEADED